LRAQAVLHVFLRLAGDAAEHQFLLEQVARHLLQRAEIGELLRRARTEEEVESAAGVHVQDQMRDRPIEAQLPVPVAARIGLEADACHASPAPRARRRSAP